MIPIVTQSNSSSNGVLPKTGVTDRTPKHLVVKDHPPNPKEKQLIHPGGLNDFFKWVNGETDPNKHNFFSVRDITKAIWPAYWIAQVVGLFDERAAKLSRALYGVGWSIVYSCYRPWKENREVMPETDVNGKAIPGFIKKVHDANEHFRFGMGSVVSAIYGGGALGMLCGVLTGKDSLFEKSAEIYQNGLFNQNQIFASMNFSVFLKRFFNTGQLDKVDLNPNGRKAKIEIIDSVGFVPDIITRGLDTLKTFGLIKIGETPQRLINALSYFKYGTWAARFGILKSSDEKGGDLEPLENRKSGLDKALYNIQKGSGTVFSFLLPGLSWASSILELFGQSSLAKKVFKAEGILERLDLTIPTWCLKTAWVDGLSKLANKPSARKDVEIPVATPA